MKKKILYFLAFIVLIQLVRPTKNKSDVASTNSIFDVYGADKPIQLILERSCNDCHSNNTTYLWYHEIAPISWIVSSHVTDGKKHLNFDEWGAYNNHQKTSIFDDFQHSIKEQKMPMASYILLHEEAILSETDKQNLIDWISAIQLAEKQEKP